MYATAFAGTCLRITGHYQAQREVRAQAGRSNKKPGQPSSGRIEGRGADRRRLRRLLRNRQTIKVPQIGAREPRKKESWEKHPFFKFLYGDSLDELLDAELTEKEQWLLGLSYERLVRFADGPDDPDLRDPMDWYKYGPDSPNAWKPPPPFGQLRRGLPWRPGGVVFHTTFESREEYEYAPVHDTMIEYNKTLDALEEEGVELKYFWAFARGFTSAIPRPKNPWDQWTLVSELAVEDKGTLDKYFLGGMIGKKARDCVAKCTSWERPDLCFVKRPRFQVRMEPQEEFFNGLSEMIDPVSEGNWRFEVMGVVRSFYEGFCRVLGISVEDDDVAAVKAYQGLDKESKSRVWEFVFTNHPMNLLHPMSRAWREKHEQGGVSAAAEDLEDGDLQEDDDEDEEEEEEEDEDEDEEEEDENKNFSFEGEQSAYWEKEMEKTVREVMEEDFFAEAEANMKGREKMDELDLASEEDFEDQEESGDSAEGQEDEKDEPDPDFEPDPNFVRSAVRPFSYKTLVREIVLLRQERVDAGKTGHEPPMQC